MLFANLIKRFNRTENKVLGRWALENCDKKINNKVDWSNTDHCGPCSYDELRITSDVKRQRSKKEDSPTKTHQVLVGRMEKTQIDRHLENTNKTRSHLDDGLLHIHRSLVEMNKEKSSNSIITNIAK